MTDRRRAEFRTFTGLLLVCGALHVQPLALAETAPAQKAVLVTGASSGLGRVMAEALAAKGYFVYAGARKDADLAELGAMKNIQAVKLDVTQQDQIDAAVKTIGKAGRGLYGLVNNAGVLVTAPLIEISEEDFHLQMNANIYGVYRVTKAFAPLIIKSKGRISVIGSISGTLSDATWGPYAMTKFAMEAYADALAEEVKQFDVRVSLIEPGGLPIQYRQERTRSHRETGSIGCQFPVPEADERKHRLAEPLRGRPWRSCRNGGGGGEVLV